MKSDRELRTARRIGFAIQCSPRRSPLTAPFAARTAICRAVRHSPRHSPLTEPFATPFATHRAIRRAVHHSPLLWKASGDIEKHSEWRTARRFEVRYSMFAAPFAIRRAIRLVIRHAVRHSPRRSPIVEPFAIRRAIRCRFSMSPDAFHTFHMTTCNQYETIHYTIIHKMDYRSRFYIRIQNPIFLF